MERFRGPIAALMCASLFIPSVPAQAQISPSSAAQSLGRSSARQPYQSGQSQGDQRILQALNRFTFGPRPGDIEAVRAVGLEKWFDRQLHPETLDESDLDARLAQFPAMQRSPQDLLYYLPSGAVIRQTIDGKSPMPDLPALHSVYANEMARVQVKRQEKEKQKATVAMATPAPAPGMAPNMGSPAMDTGGAAGTAPVREQANPMALVPAADTQEPATDPALIAAVLALPAQQRLTRLAAMQQVEFDSFRKALKGPQRAALVADLDPAQKEYVAALENPQRVVHEELAAQRLTRDIYSNAQLQETMTDFWMNHFNVFLHKDEATPYYLVSYERDGIRPRSLGRFEDLLEATAHSPAMLLYLDNSSSMGPDSPAAEKNRERDARNPGAKRKAPEGLNENYARELMELHTLGVNGGYTQADVTQVARVFTGWTVDRPQRGGGFKFDANRHEPGTKKVLGKKIDENGEQEGRKLLHMLATRPATAKFISRKLAIRFVGDDPPQSLVDRLSKSYLAHDGDVSEVLKTLFHSPEFWAANDYRAKVKTPIEFVVSAARASNATIDNMQPLVNALQGMGMPLYGAVPPTGYKWDSATWVSTGALVNRMNFALTLAANKLPGIAVAWAPRLGGSVVTQQSDGSAAPTVVHVAVESTVPAVAPDTAIEEQRLESILVVGGVSESTRSAVLQQAAAQGTSQNAAAAVAAKPMNAAQAAKALEKQDQLLAGLLLGSPEFQRR